VAPSAVAVNTSLSLAISNTAGSLFQAGLRLGAERRLGVVPGLGGGTGWREDHSVVQVVAGQGGPAGECCEGRHVSSFPVVLVGGALSAVRARTSLVRAPPWAQRLGVQQGAGLAQVKSRPSRLGECGWVDTTAACNPAAAPLLVRQADPAAERHVAALLREVPMDPGEVADLMQDRGVLVLSDLSLPPTAPPAAAVAFHLDRAARTAQLAGLGVRAQLRGRGLDRRLLTGALTWLRADGFEQVHAVAAGGGAAASLLASAGFTAAGQDAGWADGRSRLVLLL
jgi:GNAT superfamily N-acetyltransferase